MLSKSDENILNDRLWNWGRWLRSNRTHAHTSMIYRMMVAAGEITIDPESLSRIDMFDAIIVERAWTKLPQDPARYWVAKWTLAAHFACPWLSIRQFCDWVRVETKSKFGHGIRITERDYQTLLETAKCQLFNILNQQEAKQSTTCDL